MVVNRRVGACVMAIVALAAFACLAEEKAPVVYPTAILEFQERGAGVKGFGEKVADLLFASLATKDNIYLVDRSDMKKVLEEQEVNLSGMVSPANATKVGQLTGAKILVCGSVMDVDKKVILVAKVIGTETSRVLGASVTGEMKDNLADLVKKLADQIVETISGKADQLVAKDVKMTDRIAALKKALGDGKRPVVSVRITERHVGQATIDPAAQTEMALFCKETGFGVLDADSSRDKEADVLIKGEGFSEFATRKGALVSVKARVEIKAIDQKTDKVIAIDRQTAVVVDLTELIAGKAALEKAAADVAERMLPKLIAKPAEEGKGK